VKSVLEPKDKRAFQVDCTASPAGSFRAGADSLSVTIGQRICRAGREEMWDSVVVHGRQDGDEFVLRVLVCHPAWDWPVEIACLRSQLRMGAPAERKESFSCEFDKTNS
jgi:hypothetical protein